MEPHACPAEETSQRRGGSWRRPLLAGLAAIGGTVAVVALWGEGGGGGETSMLESRPLGFVLTDHGKAFAYQRLARKHTAISLGSLERAARGEQILALSNLKAKRTASDLFVEGMPADPRAKAPYDASPTADFGLVHPMNSDEWNEISRYVATKTDDNGRPMDEDTPDLERILGNTLPEDSD